VIRALHLDGETRGLPDGGRQVFGDGIWHDGRSAAGQRHLSAANDRAEAAAVLCNLEAEQGLLGCLLSDAEAIHSIGALQPVHFYEPFHQRLFEAVRQSALKGTACDPALLSDRFALDEAWVDLGGSRYLGDLILKAPPSASAPDYARALLALHTRRELIRAASEISHASLMGGDDADELLATAERLLAEVGAQSASGDCWLHGGAMVRDALAYARGRSGRIEFSFGVPALDDFTGGMNAGETTLLAARPGVGKTVAAMAAVIGNAGAGRGTCMFSLEMSAHALGLRLAAAVAYDRHAIVYSGEAGNPTSDKAMKNLLAADQWGRLEEAQAVVDRWPLLVDDRPGLTLGQIEAAARRAHKRWAKRGIPPGPVCVDHIGKLRATIDRKGNRHAEVADLSAGLAEMAKRLGVPVLALVQLNRGVEGRDDKRPILSDLRAAGELEEDCRQAIFLYRPEYYLREPTAGESFEEQTERLEKLRRVERQLYYLIEKNSHGPRGQVLAFCDIACSVIQDWEV
jgi:replicative DNA helicase